MSATGLSSPRLQRLAQRGPSEGSRAEGEEVCELCGAPLPSAHRHLVDLDSRRLLCACRPCSLLFDRPAAARGRLRLVPDRPRRLAEFRLDDRLWAQLAIPVEMAFFLSSSVAGRVQAFYPSPLGPTESHLELSAWSELAAANPGLLELSADVEALLVNRTSHHPGHWIAPVDDCYRLVAVIRTGWRGFTGGAEVWSELDSFFADLDRRAGARRSDPSSPGGHHG